MIVDGESVIGGGAAPSAVLPTRLLAVTREGLSADEISARLRASEPPVIARVEEGRVLLDLRTVFPEQDEKVIARGAVIRSRLSDCRFQLQSIAIDSAPQSKMQLKSELKSHLGDSLHHRPFHSHSR